MTYKNHTITVEVITGRDVYNLDDEGNIADWYQNIDCEPEIAYYGIQDEDGDYLEWTDTLEDAKKYIDERK